MKTQAIRIQQHGGPEVLELVEVDVGDPGPDEVRIRHHAIGLNFIDIYYRIGLYPAALPHGLGFEGAGVVDAVGANVKFLKEGDRVAYGQSPLGAYAGVRVMPPNMVVKLPAKISFDEAAAVMLKGLTVQYLFRQTYRLQGHETILFHAAAGGVGLIACQWARALGVKLIGTVSSPEKAALAKKHGAWATIDYTKENFVERVKELTKGEKVPVVYDGVGKDTWEGSLDCLQPRGLMVSFGNASGPVTGVSLGILAQKGSLFVTRPTLGTHVVPRSRLEASAEELFDLMIRGKIKVEIDQRYRLADAAQAHRDLASRKTTGSSVLTP
ncbi:quinone oxidoreductase [Betaproteobacteria bacterium PRO7]|nr:quinone oxidoreductase [Burkholderiaceae bacterium]MDL1862422.1 quinone oxidoreductase [Betaproteobacteria bacterium PRO7]